MSAHTSATNVTAANTIIANTENEQIPEEGSGDADEFDKVTLVDGIQKWWEENCVIYAFNHPHVRARMEMHMSSNLVRLTDKAYVKALIDRIYVVNEYNLHKRIADRQLDEMERLKMLILTGKTPLKACPPELFKHPVFVFWRMVNREIAKQSKKRADAYYNKLKGFKKIKPIHVEQEVIEEEVEETVYPTDEEILKHFLGEIETSRAAALEAGFRLSPREYAKLNYEAEDVKALKNMKTVEEMYRMADLIVGVPRTL